MALIKLKIEAFESPDCTGSATNTIYAVTNPESYTSNFDVQYQAPKTVNDPSATQVFTGMGNNEFKLTKLLVDGTGAVPGINPNLPAYSETPTCDTYIDKFFKVVYDYNGNIHRI